MAFNAWKILGYSPIDAEYQNWLSNQKKNKKKRETYGKEKYCFNQCDWRKC